MVRLPRLENYELEGKRVIVRGDLDIPEGDFARLEKSKKTYDYLLEQKAKIIVIGHRGRPGGGVDAKLSLAPIAKNLQSTLGKPVSFVHDTTGGDAQTAVNNLNPGGILMLENLRFDSRESFDPAQDAGAEEFSRRLASFGGFYVNECFSTSHRAHASFVGIPKFLPHAAGIRFEKEVKKLGKVLNNPRKPVVVILGGAKEDKINYIEPFTKIADKILVGGRLPEYIESSKFKVQSSKLVVADLIPDKEDITVNSIEQFEEEIRNTGTVVVSGPLGKFEDENHRQGTERVFNAVVNSGAYKVAGGGDTEAAISDLSIVEGFDWISVGGGAMLEFFANGTLPGIEALG
ncbi:hypothetical protein A3I55_02065 [Candidatus Woesebacteria bacterium RIFCSPLOWO2_02_FULL_42_10]|nr:MAG: hypothetical protein A3I55_02065 [Candidatus Woesebacteria bacterium RIFCSPLOWO2_02_FULL_42_10]